MDSNINKQKSQAVFLDFEFYATNQQFVELVCCVIEDDDGIKCYNLQHSQDDIERLKEEILKHIKQKSVFISYAFEAEARAIISLFKDYNIVKELRCLDLYIFYRQITNCNDELCLGEHFDGKNLYTIKKNEKSKYEDDDDENDDGFSRKKIPYSLVGATYRLLKIKRDNTYKEIMRNRILEGAPFSEYEMHQIIEYCKEDVVLLRPLLKEMKKYYRGKITDLLELSKYAVYSAIMVSIGYPVNVQWLKQLCSIAEFEIERIRHETHKTIFEKFGYKFFSITWSGSGAKKKFTLKENQKAIREYIAENYTRYEVSKKTKQPKLSEDALKALATVDYYNSPQTAIDYFCRYRKLIKSLKSFKPANNQKFIFDFLGSDDRIRPIMGIFGSQTSRSQPSSTSFIFLKAAVFRFVVHPPRGKILFGIDYKSQEFLIAAANSNDKNMLDAYKSGDPYMYLAINIGICPRDATKETHPKERKIAKILELALTYGMGAAGVAERLNVSIDEAKNLIKKREELYNTYIKWKREILHYYTMRKPLFLKDGWYLDVDNENMLSVGNFLGQGTGAAVMRKAVKLCIDSGLTVIFTLHDALYFECDVTNFDYSVTLAADLMRKAFQDICGHDIFVDICAWGFEDIKDRPIKKNIGGYSITCCGILYSDKVSEDEQEFWHKKIVDCSGQ